MLRSGPRGRGSPPEDRSCLTQGAHDGGFVVALTSRKNIVGPLRVTIYEGPDTGALSQRATRVLAVEGTLSWDVYVDGLVVEGEDAWSDSPTGPLPHAHAVFPREPGQRHDESRQRSDGERAKRGSSHSSLPGLPRHLLGWHAPAPAAGACMCWCAKLRLRGVQRNPFRFDMT